MLGAAKETLACNAMFQRGAKFRDLDTIALSSHFGRRGLRRKARGETELPPHPHLLILALEAPLVRAGLFLTSP